MTPITNPALLAILDNAIKFCPNGGEVRVEACKQGKEVSITIRLKSGGKT